MSPPADAPLLEVQDLSVVLGERALVRNVSFTLRRGETLALVGESGSGKSLTALSLLRLLPEGMRLGGAVRLAGTDVRVADAPSLRRLRGGVAGFVFQEPMTSLNPLHRVGRQVAEAMALHGRRPDRARVVALLRECGLADAEARLDALPHQLSGGQRQRVVIACALACDPALLIADEPTTALDVTTQAQILALLDRQRRGRGLALLLITHDLGLVRRHAERVCVMGGGRVVEAGEVAAVLGRPEHPLTRALVAAEPSGRPAPVPPGAREVLAAEGLRVAFPLRRAAPPDADRSPEGGAGPGGVTGAGVAPGGAPAVPASLAAPGAAAAGEGSGPSGAPAGPGGVASGDVASRGGSGRGDGLAAWGRGWLGRRRGVLRAVDGVSLHVREGETLGLVGESGSGKSTVGLALLGLQAAEGERRVAGASLAAMDRRGLRRMRSVAQIVFQDPFGSLSPRMSVGGIVAEGLLVHEPGLRAGPRGARVRAALAEVGLPEDAAERFPHEFSGGQRQRIAIARAMVLKPRVVVLDEPTSALDRSVQGQVVALLRELQARHGLAYLFISHDLLVVRAMAHRVAVLRAGRVVEEGETEALFAAPRHPYTRALLAAALKG